METLSNIHKTNVVLTKSSKSFFTKNDGSLIPRTARPGANNLPETREDKGQWGLY